MAGAAARDAYMGRGRKRKGRGSNKFGGRKQRP